MLPRSRLHRAADAVRNSPMTVGLRIHGLITVRNNHRLSRLIVPDPVPIAKGSYLVFAGDDAEAPATVSNFDASAFLGERHSFDLHLGNICLKRRFLLDQCIDQAPSSRTASSTDSSFVPIFHAAGTAPRSASPVRPASEFPLCVRP